MGRKYAQQGISIHSLRMEGDLEQPQALRGVLVISIHSLRMEGDGVSDFGICETGEFQSTPSAWRETG